MTEIKEVFIVYRVYNGMNLYWDGRGWTVYRTFAKRFKTRAEAQAAKNVRIAGDEEVFIYSEIQD